MIYKTKGIVLRTIKYGETSVVVNIYTELFGLQSYMVNGARSPGKTSKAHFFQPTSILDMEVYHNELKNLQRIKEVRWSYLYEHVLSDVTKHAVALFMVELVQKCLKQPENNIDLFNFIEDALTQLDKAGLAVTANLPLFFSLQLAHFFGFRLQDDYSKTNPIIDLQEGTFTATIPPHPYYVDGENGFHISQLLRALHPDDLTEIKLNKSLRKNILQAFQTYYSLHIQDFGVMKTLPILHEILSE